MKPDVVTAQRNDLDNDRESSLSTIEEQVLSDYKYGFVTDIEADEAPKGLSEDIVRFISAKKNEPEWMLEWRLKAFRQWAELHGRANTGPMLITRPLITRILFIILPQSKKSNQKALMKWILN